MSYFLITFTRGDGTNPQLERFEDGGDAMAAFTARERELRADDGSRGVVLVIADDEETLRRTHSHYFATFEELLAS